MEIQEFVLTQDSRALRTDIRGNRDRIALGRDPRDTPEPRDGLADLARLPPPAPFHPPHLRLIAHPELYEQVSGFTSHSIVWSLLPLFRPRKEIPEALSRLVLNLVRFEHFSRSIFFIIFL